MTDSLGKIFSERRPLFRLAFFLFFDAVSIVFSVLAAFLLRFEGKIPDQYYHNIEALAVVSLLVFLPVLYFFKLYSFSWVYVSAEEMVSLIKAAFLGFAFLATIILVLKDFEPFSGFPRSTLFISCFLVVLFTGIIRFAKRIFFLLFRVRKTEGKERTLIAGAGRAGEQILRNIFNSQETIFNPIGFVDDDPAKKGVLIHGLKVLGSLDSIPQVAKKEKAEGLIVALPSAGTKTIKEAVEQGRKAGLQKIRILPAMDEVISGRVRVGVGDLKDIEMEDLLGRDPVSLDNDLIRNFLQGKTVLITGASGSIGSELCRQVIKFGPQQLFLLDQDETGIFNIENELKEKFSNIRSFIADIRDKEKIERIFQSTAPEIIFHAAAYKHVPLMEENVDEAVKNNIIGTKIIVEAAVGHRAEKFVFISTDKAVNPSSVMGATKRMGEMICRAANDNDDLNVGRTKFVSVRFGNVLGSRGSVIPVFQAKIKKREDIEITHQEMKRYFMTTPEACLLVMQAGAMGEGGEVFVLDMGDPVKIVDLARELIKLSGLEPDKDIIIRYTTPRAGEKLFEELLTAEEGTVSTQNQKIFRAKISTEDSTQLYSAIEELKELSEGGKKEEIKTIFKKIIKTYKAS